MATHSSVLAWRIPRMAEPGGLPSMGLHSRTRLKWLSSGSNTHCLLWARHCSCCLGMRSSWKCSWLARGHQQVDQPGDQLVILPRGPLTRMVWELCQPSWSTAQTWCMMAGNDNAQGLSTMTAAWECWGNREEGALTTHWRDGASARAFLERTAIASVYWTLYVLGMRVSTLHWLIILLYHHHLSIEIQWDFLRRNPSNLGGAWLWEADRLGVHPRSLSSCWGTNF